MYDISISKQSRPQSGSSLTAWSGSALFAKTLKVAVKMCFDSLVFCYVRVSVDRAICCTGSMKVDVDVAYYSNCSSCSCRGQLDEFMSVCCVVFCIVSYCLLWCVLCKNCIGCLKVMRHCVEIFIFFLYRILYKHSTPGEHFKCFVFAQV